MTNYVIDEWPNCVCQKAVHRISLMCTLNEVVEVGVWLYVYLRPSAAARRTLLPPVHLVISTDDGKKAFA